MSHMPRSRLEAEGDRMKLVIRCQDHPTYRGLRKVRVDCPECEVIHKLRGSTTTLLDRDTMQHLGVRVGSA